MDKFSYLSNAEVGYIDQLYRSYQQNPHSVEESWRNFFEGFEFSQADYDAENGTLVANGSPKTTFANGSAVGIDEDMLKKEISVKKLIDGYRLRGHLQAKTNPVRPRRDRKARLALADFGLSEADLDTSFRAGNEIGLGKATLRQIIDHLKKIYEGAIGFEFMGIRDPDIRYWFRKKVETEYPAFQLSTQEKERILRKLNESTIFENFLHTKFIGQKRFSLEGGESTIPALDEIITTAAEQGVEEVVIGMAHRGRLNVLANIMQKTYEHIFTEFEGYVSEESLGLGDGDVKYHMGFSSLVETPKGKKVHLKLAPNPSHLEAVNPVVQGFVRAKIDHNYSRNPKRALPILIHGDAALAGQGIVYEIAQMSELPAYQVGGTIHFVINNQVGFTTDFDEARSSNYCTDISQLTEAPEIHVNGDDPEAVVFAVRLATEFRQQFGKDVYIDLVCYRKHGHNESDEPKFTQPLLYNLISKHPNTRQIYINRLKNENAAMAELADKMEKEFKAMLQDRLDDVRQKALPYKYQDLEQDWKALRRATPADFETSPDTSISAEMIEKVGTALTTLPEGFKPLRQIEKLLSERKERFFETKKLAWPDAELLAYGSLLLEGSPVRMSGQDVRRGTFSHRHAVLVDAEKNQQYNSLNALSTGNLPTFEIYNSLLSEYGVLGFEFGYSMANPNALVIWEAQFGDFANGAQVMIDQFISSTESKWNRMNGVTLLLPHGYEGQGPEHSSARLERFLQLSAEYNMVVANLTSAANLFHLLRRQVKWEFRKPCVVMSPKSFLRREEFYSDMTEFTQGKFEEIYGDTYAEAKKVKRVLVCSGKVYYDLDKKRQEDGRKDVAILRLEQLHPFPKKRFYEELAKYKKNVEVVWVQEEPENMGGWEFFLRMLYKEWEGSKLKVISRKASASPATGYYKVHNKEQETIVNTAFAETI
ncbi:2-oxoglutarate dehydrogenase E1 component [Hugenholtzia roseola]|uniref:2-oxoglutarate dehydrogenase E1 component n=1 Tax=Hugenholtzia roseola TaxID=1002 RepID=UPI000422203C|nr:2-oxoglutarate dehydrogenase E1 component [Hugenholtzia roseola]